VEGPHTKRPIVGESLVEVSVDFLSNSNSDSALTSWKSIIRNTQPQSGGQQGSQQNRQAPQSAEEKNETHEETTGTSNDRLFYTLPNFLTIENAKQIPPLSAKENFKVVARLCRVSMVWVSRRSRPGGEQRARVRSRGHRVRQALRRGIWRRHDRKLLDGSNLTQCAAPGSEVLSIGTRS
jgi:hypothetical protein